ncbi:MAG: Gfo/Idh/MocA family oxidoreductase [Rhizobiales bacterium]|nr:Gfo/Idh/MocA family oxidoreductase [Hyphomicrobiales bacterium]
MNKPLRVGLVGAGMVSRDHLIAWANIADRARVVAVADPSTDKAAQRAIEFAMIAHFVQSLRDNTPFETAPQDNLETLRLVEDCHRLSGWEALQ